jgi:hypothetical protein
MNFQEKTIQNPTVSTVHQPPHFPDLLSINQFCPSTISSSSPSNFSQTRPPARELEDMQQTARITIRAAWE